MDFTLPKEYQLLRRMIREFAQKELAPIVRKIDEEEETPRELIDKAAKLGLLGVPFPQKYGGMGAGEMGYCIAMEELNKFCGALAAIIGAHIGIGAMAIHLDGTEELKEKYLTPLARGELIGAFGLTEPGAGSDAASIRTRAERDGDDYVLNGSKTFITNGKLCDVVSLLAVTDPSLGARGGVTAFVVEKAFPGFSIGTEEDKMGIRGSDTTELIFENCRVPRENVIGEVGLGFVTFMKTLDIGRLSLGAACLGACDLALEKSVQWAKVRQQFGKPIAHKQSIQFMIADMATEIEALRSLVYRTAWLVDTSQPFSHEAAMCKLYGSEVLHRCADRAVQIHGGMGYMRDYIIDLMYRDARITEIFEGTSEIQRIVIASNIFRQVGVRISP
ncbi:MAG: acyl-CoA dehydrogenase [Anaerolineales bacterium]|nr:MAG: acyl-CoA dehydrogenase [Anaerolineales bacterium]